MNAAGRHQWTEDYPSFERISEDVLSGNAYIICDADGSVATYAYITTEPEPAYTGICGKWHSDGEYVVIHRLAVAARFRGRGTGRKMLEKAEQLYAGKHIRSIRVDTNHDNAEMLHILENTGYRRCGTVSYGTRGERIAFDKIL